MLPTFQGHFDQFEVNKFMEESLKMSRFKHAHVMDLIGVCLDGGPAPYIVMPYMANGSLLHYLKGERENLILTENEDEDEVKSLIQSSNIFFLRQCTYAGDGGLQASDGDVLPDSKWHGIFD